MTLNSEAGPSAPARTRTLLEDEEDLHMNMLEHELLARSRVRELRAEAEAARRARRLYVARRAARRAQRAIQRAARASAAVY